MARHQVQFSYGDQYLKGNPKYWIMTGVKDLKVFLIRQVNKLDKQSSSSQFFSLCCAFKNCEKQLQYPFGSIPQFSPPSICIDTPGLKE